MNTLLYKRLRLPAWRAIFAFGLLLGFGCQSEPTPAGMDGAPPTLEIVESPTEVSAAVIEPTLPFTTEPPTPTVEPSATPTLTAEPSLTPTSPPAPPPFFPEAVADRIRNPPEVADWPDLVWISAEPAGQMLVADAAGVSFRPLPIEVGRYYEYDAERGLMYFAQAVDAEGLGDLSVYDFASGEVLEVVSADVSDMTLCGFTPVVTHRRHGEIDLLMPYTGGEFIRVSRAVDANFSCIPGRIRTRDGGDGELIAYYRGVDLFVTNWFDGPTDLMLEGDLLDPDRPVAAPTWDLEHDVLFLLHESGIHILPLGRSLYYPADEMIADGPFELTFLNGLRMNELLNRNGEIEHIAWSPQHHALFVQSTGVDRVSLFILSEQLRTIVQDTFFWPDYEIATWLEPGETLILLDESGSAQLFSVEEQRFVEPDTLNGETP